MKTLALVASVLGCVTGCNTTANTDPVLPPSTVAGRGPNWDEVDKTVERVRQREQNKLRVVETERKVESGFYPMTDEEYAAALETARTAVRKENPKLAETDVETEATKRADEAKRRHEHSYSGRASSTYELKRP